MQINVKMDFEVLAHVINMIQSQKIGPLVQKLKIAQSDFCEIPQL